MAFLAYDPNLDPNKKLDPNAPQNISGESTSFENTPPGSTTSTPTKKSSGQYANIQAYLNSNKEQAAQMGTQITDNVEQKSQQAQSDISKLASEKQTTNAVDTNKYFADPTKLTDTDRSEYSTLKSTGGYSGPADVTGAQNYQSAYGSAMQADNLVKATGTEEGRMTLLQDKYQRPNYSRGLQSLDQALLQNDPTSKQKFADINQKYSGIADQFNQTATDLGNSINTNKQTALTNKQNIADAEVKAWQDLLNPIQTRVEQANKENPELIKRVIDDAADETLSEESLQRLGLTAGQNIYDLNLQSYLTPNYTQIGLDNAATSDERAKYLALQQLIQDPTRTQITANGQGITPIALNRSQFDKDIAAKKALAEQAMKDYRIDVVPKQYGVGFTYDSPFNMAQVDYNTFNNFAPEADKFFSQFGSNYRYDPSNYNQFVSARQALIDAAMRSGIANGNATANETSRDALILGLEQARQQYLNAQKNYGIERRIKKG